MVGYIPKLRQIIVTPDPSDTNSGNIMIFDFATKSWAFGNDRISFSSKSNIINNYDNSCMFIAGDYTGVEKFFAKEVRQRSIGSDAEWVINNLGNITTNTTYLKIGSTALTTNMDWTNSASEQFYPDANNFTEYLLNRLQNGTPGIQGNLEFQNNGNDSIKIVRSVNDIAISGDAPDEIINTGSELYAGQDLSWHATGSITYAGAGGTFGPITIQDMPFKLWNLGQNNTANILNLSTEYDIWSLLKFDIGYNDTFNGGSGSGGNPQNFNNHPTWFS